MILIVADLAVCAVVILYLLWGRRQKDQKPVDAIRLKRLIDSLGELIRESDRASRNLLDALNERHRRTEELFGQLDTKEKRVIKVVREAQSVLLRSENTEASSKYSEVSRLADMGLSAEEIARRVKLPKGEIQLILGLKQ
jgi:hypothetical protein